MGAASVGRRRVGAVIAAALVALLLAGAVGAPPSSAQQTTPEPLAFGAYAKPRNGQSERQAVEALEAQIGRKLAVVRVFETWDQPFPDSYHTWLKDSAHPMILSVKPYRSNGTRVTWASIATAAPGSQVDNEIRSWARRIKAYGVPVHVTLNHEPESSSNPGTNLEFIAAWRHWVDVFREEGVTNAKFMWIMTDYSFFVSTTDRRYAPKWYPGDAWVDSIATDPYNWHTCRPGINNSWKSLQQIIEPFRAFGALHPDKPLWLAEFASTEDAAVAGRKAAWIDGARALFKQPGWEQFQGVLYFNSTHTQSGQTVCYWFTDTTAGSLASYKAMALDPFYAGTAFGGAPPPTTTTTTTTTTTLPGGKDALLVVGSTTLNAGDTAARNRLVAAGYNVRVLDDRRGLTQRRRGRGRGLLQRVVVHRGRYLPPDPRAGAGLQAVDLREHGSGRHLRVGQRHVGQHCEPGQPTGGGTERHGAHHHHQRSGRVRHPGGLRRGGRHRLGPGHPLRL